MEYGLTPWGSIKIDPKKISSIQKLIKDNENLLCKIWPCEWKLYRIRIVHSNSKPSMSLKSEDHNINVYDDIIQ